MLIIIIGLIINTKDLSAQSKFPSTRKSPITFGLGIQYFWAEADGKGRYTSNSIDGIGFSYGNLDLDTDKIGIPVFELYFGTRMHQLHLEYMQFDLSGSDNLNKNLTIDGTQFLIGDFLATDLQTSWGKLYYEFFDVRPNYSYGILLGIEHYSFEYDIYRSSTNSHKNFDLTTINPLLGTHAMIGKGRFSVKFGAYYVPKIFDIIDYNTLDLSASFVFSFGRFMQFEGGYRYVSSVIDGSDNEDYNGIKLKGIFATLRLTY